jgi:hypothetical protein
VLLQVWYGLCFRPVPDADCPAPPACMQAVLDAGGDTGEMTGYLAGRGYSGEPLTFISYRFPRDGCCCGLAIGCCCGLAVADSVQSLPTHVPVGSLGDAAETSAPFDPGEDVTGRWADALGAAFHVLRLHPSAKATWWRTWTLP